MALQYAIAMLLSVTFNNLLKKQTNF